MNYPDYKEITKEKIRRAPIFAKLLTEISNAQGTLAKGTFVRLTGKHNSTFSVASLACPRCRSKLDFTRVPYQVVSLIDFDPEEIPFLPGEIGYLVNEIEIILGDRLQDGQGEEGKEDRLLIETKIRSFLEKEVGRFGAAINTSINGSASDGGLTAKEAIERYNSMATIVKRIQ